MKCYMIFISFLISGCYVDEHTFYDQSSDATPYCYGTTSGIIEQDFSIDSRTFENDFCGISISECEKKCLIFHHIGESDEHFETIRVSDLSKIKSSKPFQLHGTKNNDSPFFVLVRRGYLPSCYNHQTYCDNCQTQPPKGIIKVIYPNTKLGTWAKIVINGHLTCDYGQTWEQFNAVYNVQFTN